MQEKTSYLEQQRAEKSGAVWKMLEALKNDSNPQGQETAVKQLENEFASAGNLEESLINLVFDNVESSVRQQLVKTMVDSYGLKGPMTIKDSSGKWLKIELDSEPVKQEPPHGWVIRYRLLETEETDPKTQKKQMVKTEDSAATTVRKNYIRGFLNFKSQTDSELKQQRAA